VTELGITIARVGQFAVSGSKRGTEFITPVRVTFAVDSVREFEASLVSPGSRFYGPPTRRITGRNILLRDADGGDFEFVDTHAHGP
jgi:hypothetical protein